MAKHYAGITFISKGVKYVLDYGPKGNLRPYTVGTVKAATRTGNPYIIAGAAVALIGVAFVCVRNRIAS